LILDTSVLVDIDRGNHLERLEQIDNNWHAISTATLMELAVGKYRNNVPDEKFATIHDNLEILHITNDIADTAGNILANLIDSGTSIEINDTYIAATALIHNKPVLTANTQHFNRIDNLNIIDWNTL
jgi:tRNA(fMet)-specific endonuclease VapC